MDNPPNESASQDRPPEVESSRPKLRAAPRPPKTESKDKPPRRPPGRPPGSSSLEKRITEFYGNIAIGVSLINAEDGMQIMESAEPAGKAWAKLAQENPAVKRYWEKLLTGGAWGGVLMVHAPLFYSLARNHGIAPELHNPLASTNGDTPPPVG